MASRKETDVSDIEDGDDLEEEPGEVIDSAPPMKVGEERPLGRTGLAKKLLRRGRGWETPELGDEAAVHFVATLTDGTRFDSSRDRDEPLTLKLGQGQLVSGLDHGIITMKEGECALFTVPPELGYGAVGREGVPPNAAVRFEVELISWIRVVDICKDGGIVKKILVKGERNEQPSDLDEVLVKYRVALPDGTIIAEAPEEGFEFYVKDGQLCPAFSKAVMTMKKGERVKLLIQPQCMYPDDINTLTVLGFKMLLGTKKPNSDQLHNVPPNSILDVDLELVSFKPVIDVTGDGKVLKKILKEGEGAFTANEGAAVTISYAARLEDGTVFEKKGLDGEQPLNFVTDEEQVITGLDSASATMKKGELAMVTINHEYGFGSVEVEQDLAIVPPCSDLIYEVEMLDFIKERAPWEMNISERIEEAGRKKEEGNLLFKAGKLQRAGKKYDKAADYVSEDGSFGDDEQKLVKALRVACWLNAAACSLKLNNFQEAIRLCSKVLDYEFYNVKALYRRAQAYMETADLVSAELDIRKALDIDPVNREVKMLERSLKQLQAESNRRDAKVYSNMFAWMTKDTSKSIKKLKVEKPEKSKDEEENMAAMDMEKTADSSVPVETRTVVDSTLNTFS